MNTVPDLIEKLKTLAIGEEIEVAGISFKKTNLGVEIDLNEIPEDELDEHIDLLFHYEAEDNE